MTLEPKLSPVAPDDGMAVFTRNVAFNLAGQVAPALAALLALPALATALGPERLGVLTMAWLVIGYFSLLDFGLGRALTQVVAMRTGRRDPSSLALVIWSGWSLLLAAGLGGSLLLLVSMPWLLDAVVGARPGLRVETATTLRLLVAAIPLITTAAGTRGVLEGWHRFDLVNLVRVPMGVLMYAGPLLVLPFGGGVAACVAVLVAVRLAASIALLWLCLRVDPSLRRAHWPSPSAIADVLTSGLWMTTANVAGSAMSYLDRFVVTAVVSLAALAYYATPQEVILRLYVVPVAITGVMFAAMSAAVGDPRRDPGHLFSRSAAASLALLFPATAAVGAFAPELLRGWLGAEFAANGARVSQLFCLGVLATGLACTPFAFLQALGRARATGLLLLAELPGYALLLVVFTRRWGIDGAAMAWVLRAVTDASALFLMSRPLLGAAAITLRSVGGVCATVVLAFGTFLLSASPWLRGLALAVGLVVVEFVALRELGGPRALFIRRRA